MATTTDALDGLLYMRNSTARWNFPDAVGTPASNPGGVGDAIAVTYSFLTAPPPYNDVTGFAAFSDGAKTATRAVLGLVAGLVHASFTEVSGVGQMTYGMSAQSPGQGGYAYYPSYGYSYNGAGVIVSTTEQDLGGDVWLNSTLAWSDADWLAGGDGRVTLLHETGHALGLKHPFDANAAGNTLDPTLDSERYTVMSYTQASHARIVKVTGTPSGYSWTESFLRPSTFMLLDIEALQYLYGKNATTHGGNDTYGWTSHAEILETLWDGGGTDTIDASNQLFSNIINLAPGAFSSIDLRQTDAEMRAGLDLPVWFSQALPADVYTGQDNLAIAKGVDIENAIGGSAADQITGNTLNNQLTGNDGNDVLAGLGGQDTLFGGKGADVMTGGDGDDLLDGGADGDTMSGGAGSDTYSVENLADTVVELSGEGTTDTVKTNLLSYTLGNNVENLILTGAGNIGGTGNGLNNFMIGNGANNSLIGGTGDDTLSGGAGDDLLNGGTGADRLVGGLGNDTYQLGVLDTIIEQADAGIDTVLSSLAGYTLGATLENVTLIGAAALSANGNGLDNVMTGNTLNNLLQGGNGRDALNGMQGNDTLNGGAGADTLSGGAGDDVFVLRGLADSPSSTRDLITDLSATDKIDLRLIDADTATVGDQAFVQVVAFGHHATELVLTYDSVANRTTLTLDVNGDAISDLFVLMTGSHTSSTNWLL